MKKFAFLALFGIGLLHAALEVDKDPDAWRTRVFNHIYRTNHWKDEESVSGPGSSLQSTHVLRSVLPGVLRALQAHTLLDAGCGDFNWMRTLNLPLDFYIGVDIVAPLIDHNVVQFADDAHCFLCIDIAKEVVPCVEVIFCRDCLIHMSYVDIKAAIANFKKSGATYLIATHFPYLQKNNIDIRTGDFHPINLCAAPFNFPTPLMAFLEFSAEPAMKKMGKTMGVWRLADIPS